MVFSMQSPFAEPCGSLTFLDTEQTNVLVGDLDGNFFIVNMKTRKTTFQLKEAHAQVVWHFQVAF